MSLKVAGIGLNLKKNLGKIIDVDTANAGRLGLTEAMGQRPMPELSAEDKAAIAARPRMYLDPLGSNIVVQPKEVANKKMIERSDGTKGEIHMPDTVKRMPSEGVVVAVGPEVHGAWIDTGESGLGIAQRFSDRLVLGLHFEAKQADPIARELAAELGIALTAWMQRKGRPVSIGDEVLFHKYNCTEIRLPGTPSDAPSLYTMDVKNVIGVLRRVAMLVEEEFDETAARR